MYMYTVPPIMYAIKVSRAYLFVYGSYLNTGMKNVWMEKACPMEAARLTPPTPN